MRIKKVNPVELFNSVQYGFSQVAAGTGTRLIIVSGQVAWNAEQELIGDDDLFEQTRAALTNLQTALRSVEAELTDVVSLRIYIVDFAAQESAAVTRALKEFFLEGEAPTATWIGVSSLANPALKIEIEATALAE
jgi:2-iminobutanoate/2-iminopropanoate deaminase